MSQYGFNFTNYLSPASFSGDISGFTLTLNPLYTPNVRSGANPLNSSIFDPDGFDPYSTYYTSGVRDSSSLTATGPTMWMLTVSSITNTRLQDLFNSNNSGWGNDVRFYLKGKDGIISPLTTNLNTARTSNGYFQNIANDYFHDPGFNPMGTGPILSASTNPIYTSWEMMCKAMNPYGFVSDGAGGPGGTGFNVTYLTRFVDRTFLIKEPTISVDSWSSGALSSEEADASFDFGVEWYDTNSSSWIPEGEIPNLITYRGGDLIGFPVIWPGVSVNNQGTHANGALVFTYAPDTHWTGTVANVDPWADEASFNNAYSDSVLDTGEQGFPVFNQLNSNTGNADIKVIRKECFTPDHLYGFSNSFEDNCALYSSLWTLTTGLGRKIHTYTDTSGTNYDKSIFGIDAAPSLNSDCNHVSNTVVNNTSTNQIYTMDHRQYWYGFNMITAATDAWASSTDSNDIVPTGYPTPAIINQPTCGNQAEWDTFLDYDYIPAPILDATNLDEKFHMKVVAGNSWNTGVDAVMVSTSGYGGNTINNVSSSTISTRSLDVNHTYSIGFIEPKSVCMLNGNHDATAAMVIGFWDIASYPETCSADGRLSFSFSWQAGADFYANAPDDFSFNVVCHFSLNNTGSSTHSITITIDETTMGYDPITGTGNSGGSESAFIYVPCGPYTQHSMEVTPMTSSMFTTGGTGDSHIWMANYGGGVWSGYHNTLQDVACSQSSNVNYNQTFTDVSCYGGSDGSLYLDNFTNSTNPLTILVEDALNNPVYNVPSSNASYHDITGLAAGIYSITVTDSNGCVGTSQVTISEPSGAISVQEAIGIPVDCITGDGSINLTVAGGIGPYTVVWTDVNNNVLPYAGLYAYPLPSGTYNYSLTDNGGCGTVTGTTTIADQSSQGMCCTPQVVGLDPSAPGLSDGILSICINNCTTPLQYQPHLGSVNSPQQTVSLNGVVIHTDNTFGWQFNLDAANLNPCNNLVTGLTAGTYTIVSSFYPHVLDANGNILVEAYTACELTCTETLYDPGSGAGVTVGTIADSSCDPNNANTGTIEITAAGGSTSLFHHWEFTLCTDAGMTTGCQAFPGTSTFGDNTTGNVHTFTGLAPGTYYATVTPCFGANGLTCLTPSPVSSVITIGTVGGPTLTLTPTHPSCALGCDGSFTQAVTGGTAPYLYQYNNLGTWQPAGGTNWGTFTTTGHCAATTQGEQFKVIDANGCESIASITLIDPPAMDFTQAGFNPVVTDSTCGSNSGVITFTYATGGTITAPDTSYLYEIIDAGGTTVQSMGPTGAIVNQFSSLAVGTYTIKATDSNGCSVSLSETVNEVSFGLTTTKSDQSCNYPPSDDGSITVIVSPYANTPVPNYTYVWSGPNGFTFTETIASTTGTTQTGLEVGNYTITVTDGVGCTAQITETIVVSADTLENLSIWEEPMSCPTGCGILIFYNTTGDFPLYLEISDDGGATWDRVSTTSNTAATAFTSGDLTTGVQIDNNTYYKENTSDRFCFSMGSTYIARTISQANSCPSNNVSITLSNTSYVPVSYTEILFQPSCCGCNNAVCNGGILIEVANGIPINQGAALTLLSYDWTLTLDGIQVGSQVGTVVTTGLSYTVNSTVSVPNPEQYDQISFDYLYPGTYEFCTTDDCGVETCETWILIDPRVYVTDIVTSEPLCAFGCDDGTVEVTASGGGSGTYQFSIDDGATWHPTPATAATSYTFTGVGSGTWNVWARDPSCATQTLFDPTDNVLTADNGCYSDFITGLWPVGTQTSLTPISNLNTQYISSVHNSLPGSSDGEITLEILGGTAPYDIAISASASQISCDGCALQTAGVLTPGLSQYININGVNVSNTGITQVASNGSIVIDNLSVALDYDVFALGAWYKIEIKDSSGCFSCVTAYIDNGTLGIISIYSAENCNCSCPEGYSLIDPAPQPPALPCAGTTPSAPIFNNALNAPNTIQQYGGANLTAISYGSSGGRLYIPNGGNANGFTFISTGDTFYKDDNGIISPQFQGRFVSPGSGIVLEVALDGTGAVQAYGSIFDTRLWDIGVWPQQGQSSPAIPTNEWIGIPIEINYASDQQCILGIAADGNYKVTLDCGTFITSEEVGGVQNADVDILNYAEYVMIPMNILAGKHTLTFWVKNDTSNASADQVAGIAFDLFQANLPSGLSVTSVFVAATTQADLDPYVLHDVNGNPITSRNVTAGTYDHDFLAGSTDQYGFSCPSNCIIMDNGNITCLSDDSADCTMPIDCPEYLSDLVECVGTLSNETYTKMLVGLLENRMDVRTIWLVIIIKYLIKNLNPCITIQDLLLWTKFLEDTCPDCENTFEGVRAPVDPNSGTPFGGAPGNNNYDF